MEYVSIEFIQIEYDECADKLLNHSEEVSLFYTNGKYIHQIKNGEDFVMVVANQLRVYQQYTRG